MFPVFEVKRSSELEWMKSKTVSGRQIIKWKDGGLLTNKKCGEISLKDAEMVMIKAAYLPQIVKEVLY